jgi:hypothetical protein
LLSLCPQLQLVPDGLVIRIRGESKLWHVAEPGGHDVAGSNMQEFDAQGLELKAERLGQGAVGGFGRAVCA